MNNCRRYIPLIFLLLTACVSQKNLLGQEEKIAAIAKKIERYAQTGKFHGALLIAYQGKVEYKKAFGTNTEGKKNELNDSFDVASIGKMFTGIAIAQLVKAGKLTYQDKLKKYLPDYPGLDAHKELNIHQLLSHTSGLPDIFSFEVIQQVTQEKEINIEDYFDYYAKYPSSTSFFEKLPLEFEPGSRFSYSNTGYLFLGLIIEKVSGQTYSHYIQEHILIPAKMDQSKLLNAYGGGPSSLRDLFRFSQALYDQSFLDSSAFDTLTTGKISMGKNKSYGYGFEHDRRFNSLIISHKGGNANAKAQFILFPESQYVAIIYANNNKQGYKEFNKLRDYIRKILS